MKKVMSHVAAALALVVVLGAIGWFGWSFVRQNCIIWDGRIYRRAAETVDLSGKELPDLEPLSQFPNLQRINVRDTGMTIAQYENLRRGYPHCQILWDVPFQGKYVDARTQRITLTALSEEDISVLGYFSELSSIDAWQCEDYALLGALQRSLPECKVFYSVEIAGQELDCDISALELENAPYEQLRQYVEYLPNVTRIHLQGQLPLSRQLEALEEQYPDVELTWQTEAFGQALSKDIQTLVLEEGDIENASDLYYWLPYFPQLQQVDLTESGLSQESIFPLVEAYPDIHFLFCITYGHVTVRTDAEEIDFSNVKFGTTEEIEKILPCFPNLKKVVMCQCDIPSQQMARLGEKYPQFRFVWSVMLGEKLFRTDAVHFAPNRWGMEVTDASIADLQYCVDMVCVDLGHMEYVTHCDWAANMPNLKYLILADSGIRNVEGITGAKNLVFLELFQAYSLKDYSPIATCTALEDLNLCYSYGNPDPILEMTWLKRLWWSGCPWKARAEVPKRLPDTEFNCTTGSSTGGTWRKGQHYYDMRDFIGMDRMTG